MIPSKRPNEERKLIYQRLRKRKLSTDICSKLRDWTINHINLYLKNNKLKTLKIKVSGIYKK